MSGTSGVTQILSRIEAGDPTGSEELLPLVYDELRRLAAQKLSREKPGQTLQATALVHEGYLRLVDVEQAQHWNSRGHFFGAAAEAMRRILVDRAREKAAGKRGGDRKRIELDSNIGPGVDPDKLLELNEALSVLETQDSKAAMLVKLRYFAGLTHKEAAEFLGINRRAADRLWTLARTWLYRQISEI